MSKKQRSCTKFSDRCRAGEGGAGAPTGAGTLRTCFPERQGWLADARFAM